jgi:hypothetical protein
MKLPNSAHEARAWVIRGFVSDFQLLDVWALPVRGDNAKSLPTRVLWRARDRLGSWFDLGRISAPISRDDDADRLRIPGSNQTSLSERLPDELRNTAADLHFVSLPFASLYLTDLEFAAELSNRTVHGVMHMGWVELGEGSYQAQMAVYVKPRGRWGHVYMKLIEPFRYLIVYPALMRQVERAWAARDPRQ